LTKKIFFFFHFFELQQISFNVEPALEKGDVTIEYQFEGSINDVMTGFYRSRYKTAEGETKYLGSTQFEACYGNKKINSGKKLFPVLSQHVHNLW
jgi:hypothetical protein